MSRKSVKKTSVILQILLSQYRATRLLIVFFSHLVLIPTIYGSDYNRIFLKSDLLNTAWDLKPSTFELPPVTPFEQLTDLLSGKWCKTKILSNLNRSLSGPSTRAPYPEDFEIVAQIQRGRKDCGHTCLDMLGFDGHGKLSTESSASPSDVVRITGAKEILPEDPHFHSATPYLFVIATPTSSTTGHWIILYGDKIYCPSSGIWDAKRYIEEHVRSVLAIYEVPFDGTKVLWNNGTPGTSGNEMPQKIPPPMFQSARYIESNETHGCLSMEEIERWVQGTTSLLK